MTLSVDLFWSFRSPYSYLALPKTLRIVAQYDLAVNARPVYPLAVRVPGFFKKANPNFARYVVLDSFRVSQMEGIPFRFPQPDPIDQNMATLDVAPEQPRIKRLTRLGAAAQEAGKGLAFINEVATTLWNGEVTGWDQGDHLARAAARAGLDLATLDAAITMDPDHYEKIIADNEAAHAASNHWGVPCFVYKGEPFFGQDRIDLLVWRLKQHGLGKWKSK
ncbi:MAG: DsbA family protein [Rhodoblastus sp.]|nr:DsbA family protein [Rhodoblastus sp.]